MDANPKYFISFDDQEAHRLSLLNKLYNPKAIDFLRQSGLIAGMTVLVIGCGSGQMSLEIAKVVGPDGNVIATDFSEDQLRIAKQAASDANVTNITFEVVDLNEDFSKFTGEIDFIFGRWVMPFITEPQKVFKDLFSLLNKGGILAYEGSDFSDLGCFSYPDNSVPTQYKKILKKLFQAIHLPLNFIKQCYPLLTLLGAEDILVATDQAMLLNAEDKALFRLGITAEKDFILQSGILSEVTWAKFMAECEAFEQSVGIASFNRTFSISAKHP